MVSQAITRRRLLRIGAWLPLIGFLSLNLRTARAAEPALACVDPEEVGEGLRKSLHYTETSSDPQMICSGCNFFSAAAAAAAAVGGCGQCQIMSAAANARGHCDSWSKKQ